MFRNNRQRRFDSKRAPVIPARHVLNEGKEEYVSQANEDGMEELIACLLMTGYKIDAWTSSNAEEKQCDVMRAVRKYGDYDSPDGERITEIMVDLKGYVITARSIHRMSIKYASITQSKTRRHPTSTMVSDGEQITTYPTRQGLNKLYKFIGLPHMIETADEV